MLEWDRVGSVGRTIEVATTSANAAANGERQTQEGGMRRRAALYPRLRSLLPLPAAVCALA